jgi:hypothetical protein
MIIIDIATVPNFTAVAAPAAYIITEAADRRGVAMIAAPPTPNSIKAFPDSHFRSQHLHFGLFQDFLEGVH